MMSKNTDCPACNDKGLYIKTTAEMINKRVIERFYLSEEAVNKALINYIKENGIPPFSDRIKDTNFTPTNGGGYTVDIHYTFLAIAQEI